MWGAKPVTEITRRDVVKVVEFIADRGAKYQAHNVLGHVRAFFNWAINRGIYGLETSPCDRLKPAALIGERAPRQRVLSDAEIAALWRVTGGQAPDNQMIEFYPFGPLYRLLLLTGQRKAEVAGARWREFDSTRSFGPCRPSASNPTPRTWCRSPTMPWRCCRRCRGSRAATFCSRHAGRQKAGERLCRARRSASTPRCKGSRRRAGALRHPRPSPHRANALSALRVPEPVAEMVIGHARRDWPASMTSTATSTRCARRWSCGRARLRDIVEPPPENVSGSRRGRDGKAQGMEPQPAARSPKSRGDDYLRRKSAPYRVRAPAPLAAGARHGKPVTRYGPRPLAQLTGSSASGGDCRGRGRKPLSPRYTR